MAAELSYTDIFFLILILFVCGLIFVFIKAPHCFRSKPKRRKSSGNIEFSDSTPSLNGQKRKVYPSTGRAPLSSLNAADRTVFEFLTEFSMASVAWCCQAGAVLSVTRGVMIPKPNQDRILTIPNFMDDPNKALFAVFDGHGDYGGEVADFVVAKLPSILMTHPNILDDPGKALKEAFLAVNNLLIERTEIQSIFGGTTAVVALLMNDTLWVANCGDSRAVMGTKSDNGYDFCTGIALTEDQTPDVPAERERIEKLGGFISTPLQSGLNSRVWLDPEKTMVGLAMSRSIGDLAVKKIGVTAEPVITTRKIRKVFDRFLLLCSDGVFTFITTEEAASVISGALSHNSKKESTCMKSACASLMTLASSRWREKVGVYRDDVSVLLVLFHPSMA